MGYFSACVYLFTFLNQDYGRLSFSLRSHFSGGACEAPSASSANDSINHGGNVQMENGSVGLDSDQRMDKLVENVDSSNGKMMLIDGTAIIYRAYYKLLGM